MNGYWLAFPHVCEVISMMLHEAEGCAVKMEKNEPQSRFVTPDGASLTSRRSCFEVFWVLADAARCAARNQSLHLSIQPAGREEFRAKNPRAAHKGKIVSFITRERREFHCALVHFISFDLISCLISVDLSVKLKYLWERSVKSKDGENIIFFFEILYLREHRKTHVINFRRSNFTKRSLSNIIWDWKFKIFWM
jgi:hypothetical protein